MRNYFQLLRLMLAVLTISLSLAGVTVAQEITGSIVGTVKDANGAGVAGVQMAGEDGHGAVVMFAFPFETITTAENRAEVMKRVLDFFHAK